MKKLLGIFLASAVVLAASGGVAHAAVGQMIDLEVQGATYQDSGPVLTNGYDYYDYSLSSATGESNRRIPLIEADGSETKARLTYTTDASTAINTDPNDPAPSTAMLNTQYVYLFDGYMNAESARTIFFTGLDASKSYEMVVYAQREEGQHTSLKINGNQVISNASDLSALTEATANNSYNGNYAYISGIQTDATGKLSFTYEGQIDGFQVKEAGPVPEPASLMLLGVGGLLGAYRMRRTREKAVA